MRGGKPVSLGTELKAKPEEEVELEETGLEKEEVVSVFECELEKMSCWSE